MSSSLSMRDSEKAILIPSPGGRGPATIQRSFVSVAPAAAQSPAAIPPLPRRESPLDLAHSGGLNLLVAAANPLLNLVSQLRTARGITDPIALREKLVRAVRQFDAQARAAGIAHEKVIAARYALCTLLDETVVSTPWGGSGIWAGHSLLVHFHNEAWGGEKFFVLLGKLAENVAPNRDLLELMYLCLALGLQGRFAVMQNGRNQLEALKERLSLLLMRHRGRYDATLSPHWQSTAPTNKGLLGSVPVWVGAALVALLLAMAFFAFSWRLNSNSDPVYARLQNIRAKAVVAAPLPVPAQPAPPRLARFLEKEIAAGLVTVRDYEGRSVVTIRGDSLFASGSDSISAQHLPLLLRIADALNETPGAVVVAGHSDSQPIRSLRFPSNWHLSNARAESVAALLKTRVQAPGRVKAEGRADAEPIADNTTYEGRALNRRVEITLLVPHSPAEVPR